MVESGSVRTGLLRRRGGWRLLIVVTAIALAGATAFASICHEEHEADQDCAVCQFRHQPAAELSASPQIGIAEVPAPLEPEADGRWIASGHSRHLPARAPPA